jgi:hypothetical protein
VSTEMPYCLQKSITPASKKSWSSVVRTSAFPATAVYTTGSSCGSVKTTRGPTIGLTTHEILSSKSTCSRISCELMPQSLWSRG